MKPQPNSLPDSAFAVVLDGGTKGDNGRTMPLTLRKFPHHDAAGKVDSDRVTEHLKGIDTADVPDAARETARAHLENHAADHEKKSLARAEAVAGLEHRVWRGEGVKVTRRSTDGATTATFEGYAAMFNSVTTIAEGSPWAFQEVIAPGAFSRTIKDGGVAALMNHDPNMLLGRQSNGTLTVREDQHGLWTAIDLPDTQPGRDVATLTERRDLEGMSFSFSVPTGGDRWETLDDGTERRTLLDLDAYDVGPVAFPQYTDTTASMRSAQIARRTRPDLDADPPQINAQRHNAPDETGPDEALIEQRDREYLANLAVMLNLRSH